MGWPVRSHGGRQETPSYRAEALVLLGMLSLVCRVDAADDAQPAEDEPVPTEISVLQDPPLQWREQLGGWYILFLVTTGTVFLALVGIASRLGERSYRKRGLASFATVMFALNTVACLARLILVFDPLRLHGLFGPFTTRMLQGTARLVWFIMVCMFLVQWRRIVLSSKELSKVAKIVDKRDRILTLALITVLIVGYVFQLLEAASVEGEWLAVAKRSIIGVYSFGFVVFGVYYGHKLDLLLRRQTFAGDNVERTRRKVQLVVRFSAAVAACWLAIFCWALFEEGFGPEEYLAYHWALSAAEASLAVASIQLLRAGPASMAQMMSGAKTRVRRMTGALALGMKQAQWRMSSRSKMNLRSEESSTSALKLQATDGEAYQVDTINPKEKVHKPSGAAPTDGRGARGNGRSGGQPRPPKEPTRKHGQAHVDIAAVGPPPGTSPATRPRAPSGPPP